MKLVNDDNADDQGYVQHRLARRPRGLWVSRKGGNSLNLVCLPATNFLMTTNCNQTLVQDPPQDDKVGTRLITVLLI
jgi:hypothetical protein